jgi:glyoxylase-like metal-dependent hydrolase (beta-lactamase superfamily II)
LLNEEDGLVFSGDTMFKNGVGRTDFKYSSFTDLQESLDKLNKLPGKWLVYPGHGEETGIFN